jgi:hypothetical protein
MAQHPRRQSSSYSPRWELDISPKSYWFNKFHLSHFTFSPQWKPQKAITTHKTMLHHMPEDHRWHFHCHENLKSLLKSVVGYDINIKIWLTKLAFLWQNRNRTDVAVAVVCVSERVAFMVLVVTAVHKICTELNTLSVITSNIMMCFLCI